MPRTCHVQGSGDRVRQDTGNGIQQPANYSMQVTASSESLSLTSSAGSNLIPTIKVWLLYSYTPTLCTIQILNSTTVDQYLVNILATMSFTLNHIYEYY